MPKFDHVKQGKKVVLQPKKTAEQSKIEQLEARIALLEQEVLKTKKGV